MIALAHLAKAEVWRGGVASGLKKQVDTRLSVAATTSYSAQKVMGLYFAAAIPSKGGGDTMVTFWIPPGHFGSVVERMVIADPAAAREAFREALRRLDAPPSTTP